MFGDLFPRGGDPFNLNFRQQIKAPKKMGWRPKPNEYMPPAIVWGGTIGFGWGVLRYMTSGQPAWEEAFFMAIPGVIICAGFFYLKLMWQHRKTGY